MSLKTDYDSACSAYIQAFADRHSYEYEPYSSSEIMCFGDLYVDMATIRTDVDRDAPEDEFIKWYDYTLRVGMLGAPTPNFDNWLRKCPIRSEEEIKKMEETRARIEELEGELKKMCDEK